ncbi:MAG: hypothetical protein CVU09_15150 [Bacteroidetes bacterium HGW-Bacteroidetes-4]|jgi:hypothetical protein|nr:MAG: hypothetical protein CVU09_15150 [Bacteroidetes bacterium HGW-Bacteroidetes-4]
MIRLFKNLKVFKVSEMWGLAEFFFTTPEKCLGFTDQRLAGYHRFSFSLISIFCVTPPEAGKSV